MIEVSGMNVVDTFDKFDYFRGFFLESIAISYLEDGKLRANTSKKIFDHIRVMRYTRTFFGYSSVFSFSFLIFVCIFRSLLLESEKYSLRVGPHSVTISVSCPFSLSISLSFSFFICSREF